MIGLCEMKVGAKETVATHNILVRTLFRILQVKLMGGKTNIESTPKVLRNQATKFSRLLQATPVIRSGIIETINQICNLQKVLLGLNDITEAQRKNSNILCVLYFFYFYKSFQLFLWHFLFNMYVFLFVFIG